MPDQRVLDRITAWQAAGLIDGVTADRLRIAEAAAPTEAAVAGDDVSLSGGEGRTGRTSMIGSVFGPSPTVSELFAYLGAGFVIAAWHVLVLSWRPTVYPVDEFVPTPDYLRIALEWGVPVVVLAVIGWLLATSGERQRRAAGVFFGAATIHVYGAVAQLFQDVDDFRLPTVVAGAAAAIAATLFRLRHAALVTQATLIAALALFAGAAVSWLEVKAFGEPYERYGQVPGDPLVHQLLGAAWWIGWAIVFGIVAWREARSAAAPERSNEERAAARRRADLTRFAAGLTAVGGVASSLAFGDRFTPGVLDPWIGDLALLGVSAVLLALAARAAPAYLYPAALGVIIALTSLNGVYVAEQTGVGIALLVEGVILLGAGFAADRMRRRLARTETVDVAPA